MIIDFLNSPQVTKEDRMLEGIVQCTLTVLKNSPFVIYRSGNLVRRLPLYGVPVFQNFVHTTSLDN